MFGLAAEHISSTNFLMGLSYRDVKDVIYGVQSALLFPRYIYTVSDGLVGHPQLVGHLRVSHRGVENYQSLNSRDGIQPWETSHTKFRAKMMSGSKVTGRLIGFRRVRAIIS